MTKIDFHSNVPDKIAYACRLVRKARTHATHLHIVVLTADPGQLAAMDHALWVLSDVDFLPHVRAGDPLASHTPVILTDSDATTLEHHHILINLSDVTPSHFSRFERLFEIISNEEKATAAGRQRYAFYKQQGYPLTHFVAEQA